MCVVCVVCVCVCFKYLFKIFFPPPLCFYFFFFKKKKHKIKTKGREKKKKEEEETMASKVCLNMIVKNESRIILRCLSSLVKFVHCYIIHDTGSDDGTPELIQKFFDEHKVPGRVVHTQFENFEHNRNLALKDAMAEEGVDFILLLDADMQLCVPQASPEEFWSSLTLPAYRVCQKSSLVYYNVRLLGKPCFTDAKYIGVTHEYLNTGPHAIGTMDPEIAYMPDSGDGGCKQDKFVRDKKLLEQDVKNNPKNVRSWFYLGQTYKDMGKNSRAIATYRKYLELHSWDEERFMAQYMIGFCFLRMGNTAQAFEELTKAFEMRPSRSEPLYHMVKTCREKGWHQLGWVLAMKGTQIPFPSRDVLFVEKCIYDYMFWYELHILASYVRPEKGLSICDYLLLNRKTLNFRNDSLIQNIKQNMVFYLKPFGSLRTEKISIPNQPEGYNAMNPSVLSASDDSLLVNVRLVNYQMSDQMQYSLLSGDPISESSPVHTRNFRTVYHQKGFSEGQEVHFHWDGPFYPNLCTGYEDVRIFKFKGKLHASCTTRFIVESGTNSIALIDPENRVELLESPYPGRCEKNWLFFENDYGELCHIYSYSPLTIYSGSKVVCRKDHPDDFQDFRGSAGPVGVVLEGKPYYLVVVHEVLADFYYPRRYVHRFLLIDIIKFEIAHVSLPFTLADDKGTTKHIQYVSGMAGFQGNQVVLGWGSMDAEAYLSFFDLGNVLDFTTAKTSVL